MHATYRRIARICLKTLRYLLGGACALVLAVLVLNQFDEKLSPGAAAWSQAPAPIPPARNAYFAMLSLAIDTDHPIETGKALASDMESAPVDGDFQAMAEKYGRYHRITVNHCPIKEADGDCYTWYIANTAQYRAQIAQENTLLGRYQSMLDLPDYQSARSGMFMTYSQIMDPAELTLADASLRIHNGDDSGYDLLARDMMFWMMVQSRSHVLIECLIASSQLRRDMRLTSAMIQHHEIKKQAFSAKLLPTLAIFARRNDQALWERLMQGEFQYVAGTLNLIEKSHQGLFDISRWSYEPNATANLNYLRFSYFADHPEANDSPICQPSVKWIYNSMGHILSCIGSSDMTHYSASINKTRQQARALAQQLSS